MHNKLNDLEIARRLKLGLAKLDEAYRLLREIGRQLEEKHGERKAA